MAKPYLLQELENKEEKVFYAIYNETTYEELLENFNDGKIIKVLREGSIGHIDELFFYSKDDGGIITDFYFSSQTNPYYIISDVCHCTRDNDTGQTLWSVFNPTRLHGTLDLEGSLQSMNQNGLPLNISYHRPITISNSSPSSASGNIGDIWIKYST